LASEERGSSRESEARWQRRGAEGPVGFSAALLPYLSAIGEKKLADAQSGRLRSAFDSTTGLYGRPSRYYDQNLALFALGWTERRFWFDSSGTLKTWWKN
jgi:endoglucanase